MRMSSGAGGEPPPGKVTVMRPDGDYWTGRTVAVVGGTGFLGLHLVRLLRGLGAKVQVVGLPSGPAASEHLSQVRLFVGDVRNAELVGRGLAGCTVVFNVAGPAAASGPELEAIHVAAIRQVLAAAPATARIVHTSSIVTLGTTRDGRIVDEENPAEARQPKVDYVRAKCASEGIALAGAATRPVVIVNPGYLIGPDDFNQSVMGRVCVRFWQGRLPLAPPGGFNVVDVRDAALGHLLAAERGQSGRRYVLGGHNISYREFLEALAEVAHFRPRWLPTLPGPVLLTWARLAQARAWLRGKPAFPSPAEARLSRRFAYVSWRRAAVELGYAPRPLSDSLRDCYAFHRRYSKIQPRGLSAWWLRAPLAKAS